LALAVPGAAHAATIVVVTDPMSLEKRTVVLDTPGPDRLFVCAAPPAVSGCREMPIRR
jgi:hypothetical protein